MSIFVEKYRPSTLENVILNPSTKKLLKNILESPNIHNDFTNLLFSGSPGCGKCHSGDQEIEIFVDQETFEKIFKK